VCCKIATETWGLEKFFQDVRFFMAETESDCSFEQWKSPNQ